jgi:amino acid transporter
MQQRSTSAGQLKAGQLGTVDVTASTVANIGPGIDFYFAFGVIAVTAGVAAPLTILAGAVACVLLAFIVDEFTKAEPSAGSFITYVETSLGARAGVVAAPLVAVGFTVAIAGVFTMSGGMVALTLAHYTSWQLPWEPLSLVQTAEECRDPRRTIPRALYVSIAIGAALFVLFAYATVTGFGYDVSSIGRSSVPFLTVADRYLGTAAILAWIGGIVSVLATFIAGVNSQACMLFGASPVSWSRSSLATRRSPTRHASS